MPFQIIRNDITRMKTDAIVNAANTDLLPGGGVCGAIFSAAGYEELDEECSKIGHCDTGKAVITKGYNLAAKYIIHTPGPIYRPERSDNEELLYSCYKSSLELAKEHELTSISFPLISSGIYGYPAKEALRVATKAISDFLNENDMDIYLVVYNKGVFTASVELFNNVKEYIDSRLVVEPDRLRRLPQLRRELYRDAEAPMEPYISATIPAPEPSDEKPKKKKLHFPKLSELRNKNKYRDLTLVIEQMDASFSETLLYLIDQSGMTDAQVYKKANIDRKLFSKIRSNPTYKPKKNTAIALAIALELDMEQMKELVARAGYSFTHSSVSDIIIEYFVSNGNYDIFEINEVLFAFDQQLIGA
ncbi:MAG: macro domain-containing protein [Clostridia bacterium]|nr:macro domain-containing protein [Clostridia bacterium]